MKGVDLLHNTAIVVLILVHLLVAPYTKVEESFNIQATHDILAYGIPTRDVHARLSAQYDHFGFPGAVPRTFVGPVLLAGLSQPLVALFGFRHAQLIVRGVLGLLNAAALLVFKANVAKALGPGVARWYVAIQLSQFHVLFYASRTLPNIFAFGLTTLAFSQTAVIVPDRKAQIQRFRLAICLLTCAAAIFRAEVAILLICTVLQALVLHRVPLSRLILPFIVSFVFSLVVSIPLDSYFWQKPLWPELWGFYFNVVQGSSSEWGVSPWHFYFSTALRKLFANPAVWMLWGIAVWSDGTFTQAMNMLLPSLLFTAIYSFQPHKETRFIFYIVPPLTALAAQGANYISARRDKSVWKKIATVVLGLIVHVFLVLSTGILIISALNYPGGEALSELRKLVTKSSPSSFDSPVVTVHTDVLSCMTGVTLFGQNYQSPTGSASTKETVSFTFDKTEDDSVLHPEFWEKFDYALAEDPGKVLGSWEVIGLVEGFSGVELLRPGVSPGGLEHEARQTQAPVLGRGATVKAIRDQVREITGGWWIGPRMEPKVRLLRRLREGDSRRIVSE